MLRHIALFVALLFTADIRSQEDNSCGLTHPFAVNTVGWQATIIPPITPGHSWSDKRPPYQGFEPAFLTIDQTANNTDHLNWIICPGDTFSWPDTYFITIDLSWGGPWPLDPTTLCASFTPAQSFFMVDQLLHPDLGPVTVPWPWPIPDNLANPGNNWSFDFYCQAIGWELDFSGWWVSNAIRVNVWPFGLPIGV